MKVYTFIAAEKPAVRNVNRGCVLLSVSRSAYYEWSSGQRSKRGREDDDLRQRVHRIHKESRGTYGSPRIHRRLRHEGIHTSRKRVARVMAQESLFGRLRRRSRRTTIASSEVRPELDLLQRDFTPDQRPLNTAWVGDITYIRTWEGWAYLATVIDLASRRVVGFSVADHMRTSLIADAMEMALKGRRPSPGLIFHTDRGSQYTSAAFRVLLDKHNVRQSLSRPRQCWDNAVAESFFSTLKTEMVHRMSMHTVSACRTAVFEYIEVFYNRQRLHSALDYLPPAAYEESRLSAPIEAPAA